MKGYPFSGTLRDNIIDPFPIDPKTLIENYCALFGISHRDLYATGLTGKVKKRDLGLNLSTIRMALAYYIHDHCNIGYSEASRMLGYRDHSTPMKNEPRVRNYIDHQDSIFYPYWEKLLNIA